MQTVKQGDTLITLMGSGGNIGAYKVCELEDSGELGLVVRASDGPGVVRVLSMEKSGEIGFEALSADEKVVALKSSKPALGMIMIFIDEAIEDWAGGGLGWYYPDNTRDWDAHANRWAGLVEEYGPPEYARLFQVYNSSLPVSGNPLKPASRSFPEEIPFHGIVPRPPSLDNFISYYNACKGGADKPHPREVMFNIDVSGSMTRYAIEPGIDEFEEWLNNGGTKTPDPLNPLPPIAWREHHDSTQFWLQSTCNWYESLRQEYS